MPNDRPPRTSPPAATPPASTRALPALGAFQAFESAARLGSFTRAARERHLTHGAISRAVHALEHWHGQPLFSRHGPRVRLTAAGEALREQLAEPLQALLGLGRAAGPATAREPRVRQLTVHTLGSLVATWLMPRLPELLADAPWLQLVLRTGSSMETLAPHEAAVALRLGRFDHAGLACTPLWRDSLVAVARPDRVAGFGDHPAAWPASRRLRLLDEPWPSRLDGHRLAPATGPAFNDALLVVQAALTGLGVAWLRRSLAAPWLADGTLRCLASQDAQVTDKTMWLVHREELADDPAVRTFSRFVAGIAPPVGE